MIWKQCPGAENDLVIVEQGKNPPPPAGPLVQGKWEGTPISPEDTWGGRILREPSSLREVALKLGRRSWPHFRPIE